MINLLRPDLTIASFAEVNPEAFRANFPDAGAITLDADKTIVGQDEALIPDEQLASMRRLQESGLMLAIISNASSDHRMQRIAAFSEQASAAGIELPGFTSGMDGYSRKPSVSLFNLAAQSLGLDNSSVVHFGDQILKDILGAKRAGYGGSVLVAPYGEGDHLGVKAQRALLEAPMRPFLGVPLRTADFNGDLSGSDSIVSGGAGRT